MRSLQRYGGSSVAERTLPFELVTFPSSAEAEALLRSRPEDLQTFYVTGVPKGFVSARYRANRVLSLRTDNHGRQLIAFGTMVLDGAMCLDPVTGEVVQLVGRSSNRFFVNSTLASFTRLVREVSNAFPFYSDDASRDEIMAAAEAVSEIVRKVDGEALVPDRYWSTLIDDMRMGDWATDAVLELVASGY